MTNKTLKILLIEDDTIEVMKFKRVIQLLEGNHQLLEAKNGETALTILAEQTCKPNIIILDLNMPKMNGIEFLSILKNDKILKYIPVVILTTSSNDKDIQELYKIGIAGYFVKPLKYEDYVLKVRKVLDYWCTSELPVALANKSI
ncbi:response regulator [Flavobacterium capsici]|uniref:Response regulator n=1 Tax=Flavobacterium capsici TaxID=3075618 RepID=A0AA96F3J9_9FLAO|nr:MULTISPECIES: response regulator [unclassified Flavobacterium]WNM18874.1 response regulator [Flavobacterium sp. PMR2A8]WNM22924.1 response regulator [Flavobacterium sp. PMTSA4]